MCAILLAHLGVEHHTNRFLLSGRRRFRAGHLEDDSFDKVFIDVISVEYIIWKGSKEQEEKKLNDYREFFKNVGGYSEGKVHKGDVYFQKLT